MRFVKTFLDYMRNHEDLPTMKSASSPCSWNKVGHWGRSFSAGPYPRISCTTPCRKSKVSFGHSFQFLHILSQLVSAFPPPKNGVTRLHKVILHLCCTCDIWCGLNTSFDIEIFMHSHSYNCELPTWSWCTSFQKQDFVLVYAALRQSTDNNTQDLVPGE